MYIYGQYTRSEHAYIFVYLLFSFFLLSFLSVFVIEFYIIVIEFFFCLLSFLNVFVIEFFFQIIAEPQISDPSLGSISCYFPVLG